MDFGLREWLIIIGLLVIVGILIDGWRRMGGRSKIRFKLERNIPDLPDNDNELLGPPRVISRGERTEPQLGDDPLSSVINEAADDWREPQQVGLDFDPDEPATGFSAVEPEPLVEPKAAEPVRQAKLSDAPLPEEVLVILVVARDEEGFPGGALLQNVMESGLRHGDMDIFHRHESMSGNGDILFSMANALKPGTFDIDAMDDTPVRAVSFFMSLPGPRHPKQALDLMIAAARKLSHELGGDVKDEQRSVLTAQTIEHYRQRIAEFERKQFAQRR
ncbi:MAG: cell division protein ZipA [Halopseudomonas yangmingensis]|uniref:Cell division protein ZipA n=1 Tax=Halopseudomonas yangmingensis TaxID=1720063 RepID=A0A1I4NG47_9GAMM|nr:cell division protein ZipA [Halopseudomonas yangmingensis]SFM14163.1 cell division protein ZipA [Halopseudomonas yangmingensis]